MDYKLRITFIFGAEVPTKDNKPTVPPQQFQLKQINDIMMEISKYCVNDDNSKWVSAIEYKNSNGEITHYHTHAHFNSNIIPRTLKDNIKRIFKKQTGINLVGNKLWSLKVEPFINEHKFYAYPLKQQENFDYVIFNGFSVDQLKDMRSGAYQTWLTAIEVNNAKANKRDPNETLYDRLEEACKGLKSLRDIQYRIIDIYLSENRACNKQTIIGYANTVALKYKIISYDEFLN